MLFSLLELVSIACKNLNSKKFLALFGGSRLNTFDFLPALGSVGGIIIAWDRSQFNGTLIHKGTYSITKEFTNQSDNSIWICTSVYRPNTRSLKIDFWNEHLLIRNLHTKPWLICGDFKMTFTLEDKNKGDSNPRDIDSSQDLLGELNLIVPPLHGRSFT